VGEWLVIFYGYIAKRQSVNQSINQSILDHSHCR